MYEALLAAHLVCAVLWAGGGVTLHMFGRRAVKAGPEAGVDFSRNAGWVGSRVYAPLSVLLLLFGILLVGETGFEHSDPWISFAYLAWLIAFVLGAVVYPGVLKKVEDAVAEHGKSSDEAKSRVGTFLTLNTIEITLLLLVVIDMAVKPGA